MEIYFKIGLVVSSITFILGIFMLFNKDYYKENIDYGYNNFTDILIHSVLYILILLSYCALMITIYPLSIIITLFYLYHKRK